MRRRIIFAVIVIALLEGGARLAGAPEWAPNDTFIQAREWDYLHLIDRDTELFWKYRPNQTIKRPFFAPGEYEINSDGFRGSDTPEVKPEGSRRVVCFGESATFGWGVSEDAAYPRQLEERLNQLDTTGERWHVINAGVTNYSTHQAIALAKRWVPRWKPDIVLYDFSWGDHQPAGNGIPDKDIRMPAPLLLKAENLLMRSRAFQWARRGWQGLFAAPAPQPDPSFRTWRVGPVDFNANIEHLVLIARENRARAIIVTSPISWPPPGMSDTSGVFHYHHRYHRTARYAAIAAGAEYVELANQFNAHREFFDDVRRDNEHYNSAGHAFAGELIARYILGAVQDTTAGNR